MMKGIELLGKGVRVASDKHIVRVPLKTGETALVQLNNKLQQLDCITLSKGKIVGSEVVEGKNAAEGVFDQLVAAFTDRLAPLMKEGENGVNKFLTAINKKAIG